MRRGQVDLCITGTDRTTASGDVANKIGTYLKALAAADNAIPFYVALPSPTIDWDIEDGSAIPIEQRDPREVTHIAGWTEAGARVEVRLTPADSPAANYAFDVTPARLVTGLITEGGLAPAPRGGLLRLSPAPPPPAAKKAVIWDGPPPRGGGGGDHEKRGGGGMRAPDKTFDRARKLRREMSLPE